MVCKIVVMRDVLAETSAGYKLQLKNVRHVPDNHLNLISFKPLDIEGGILWRCQLQDRKRVTCVGKRRKIHYSLQHACKVLHEGSECS